MVTKILAVAGWVGTNRLSRVECFDPSTEPWSGVAAMGTARYSHGVSVVDGKLYAVGGFDGTNRLSSVECFDPSTGQWSGVAAMSTTRSYFGVAVVECLK